MKVKKPRVKHLFAWILVLVMIFIVVLAWKVYGMETPLKVKSIIDGNTIVLANGKTVGLMGINIVPGGESDLLAKQYLKSILDGRNIWVEYTNFKGDINNTRYAWIWVGCESRPRFLASNLSGSKENPVGCKKGALVNEQIVKMGWSEAVTPMMGERMKYQERMDSVEK